MLGDFIEDENVPGPVDAASKQLLKEQVHSILDSLSDREREVLEMRFGLKDGQAHTLEEVGEVLWRHARAHPADRSQGAAQAAPSVSQPEAEGLFDRVI